jgi:uncharacterized membrane protein YeaQ/YmgE (transglycosylase-associated protein family)
MTVTGIISALVIGLIIGALARLVLPGKQSIPVWLTILIGASAILGTLVAQYLGVTVTPASTGSRLSCRSPSPRSASPSSPAHTTGAGSTAKPSPDRDALAEVGTAIP